MLIQRRVTTIVVATITSALLFTGCSNAEGETGTAAPTRETPTQEEPLQDETPQESAGEIPIPPNLERVDLPRKFPKDFPIPPSPHAVVDVAHEGRGYWTIVTYYAKDLDLDAEIKRFKSSLVKDGYTVTRETPMEVAPGPAGIPQANLEASSSNRRVNLLFSNLDGQTPAVTVMTAPR